MSPRIPAFLVMMLSAGAAFAGNIAPNVGVPEPNTLSLIGLTAAACAIGVKLRKRSRKKDD